MLLVGAFLLFVGRAATDDDGLKIGSTTYTAEFDPDDSQDNWFDFQSWQNARSFFRRLTLRLSSGVLTIESEYSPGDVFRRRLPRDVPSLIKHLHSRNRFELKVAAQLLAEHRAKAVPALPALFTAWAADPDLSLNEEILVIATADPLHSVQHLIQTLSATNAIARVYSAHLLAIFTTNAVSAAPALRAAFETNKTDRAYFARAYFKIKGECAEMIPALREILKSEERPGTREKQTVLGILEDAASGGAEALPEVLNLVQAKPSSQLNGVALLTFSKICDNKQLVLQSILEALNSNERSFPGNPRSDAILSLANLGADGLPYLINLYTNGNSDDRYMSARALIKLGHTAAPYLDIFRAELRSADRYSFSLACEIIAGLGTNSAPAGPELKSLLKSSRMESRAHAAAALIKLGFRDNEIVEAIVDDCAAFSPWGGFGLPTLIDLIIYDERSRAIIELKLKSNPVAAKHLIEQIDSWRIIAKSWGMEAFFLLLHAQTLEDFLNSIGYLQQS